MIHTSTQLKALIRNESHGDSCQIRGDTGYDENAMKIDISTDDLITPKEVNYEYTLMFEERTIPLLAYNLETVLAEKWKLSFQEES